MMNRDEAREVKAQLADYVDELVQRQGLQPLDLDITAASGPTLGLGLAPRDGGGYAMAVRYRLGVPAVRRLARKVVEQAGPAVDVRRTGRIRPVTTGHVADAEGAQRAGQRLPVATALAEGETGRARPLRPGVSIAHVDVTAGTLGAFVVRDGALHVLSNFHVLAGTPRAQIGDVIVQPGPADDGRAPRDRVGTLAATVPLERGRRATVDAALALLDEQEVDLRYPVGPITTTTVAFGNEEVAKIGRTTAVTTGRVTAIELDDVVVGYGNPLGNLRFDDQIEVESTGMGPFSRGGDSGSLVYRADGIALGLLFAGSETGGPNGSGLTYLNPIDAVLSALGVELAS